MHLGCELPAWLHTADVTASIVTEYAVQVKTAVPNVEERTYKKGAVLVQQGQVPDGIFLILSGTCELVLLSQLPAPQSVTPTHSSKPSFTTAKAVAAAVMSGRESPGLLRTQSSSPCFAMPPKRDADIDFAGHLSDSDETTESDESGQQQHQQEENSLEADSVNPILPFFRVTASADGSRRLQSGGLLGSGANLTRPWTPGSRPSASPPPIIEGVPSAPSPDASGRDGGFFMDTGNKQILQLSAGTCEAADGKVQAPSFSASGGRLPGAIVSASGGIPAGLPPLRTSTGGTAATTAAGLAAGLFIMSGDGTSQSGTPQSAPAADCPSPTAARSPTGRSPRGGRFSHVKACSVDFGMLEVRC
jgi:hypothetical protein